MTQSDLLGRSDGKKSEISKIQQGGGCHLE